MPHEIANAIMGKLYDILTNGDEDVPKSTDNFFSWNTPGTPCDPADFEFLAKGLTGVVTKAGAEAMLAAVAVPAGGGGAAPTGLTDAQINQLRASDTARLYAQAEQLARWMDFVPDVNSVEDKLAPLSINADEGTLSEIYERTLRMSQVMESPLSDEQKKQIEHLRSLLVVTSKQKDIVTLEEIEVTEPSPLVKVYSEKMKAYDDAALEYNVRRVDALTGNDPEAIHFFGLNAKILRDKVRFAMDDWVGAGHKLDYEKVVAAIAAMEARDVTLLKRQYLDDLDKAKLTGIASGSDFYYTQLIPASFATSTGWSRFTFNSGHYANYQNSRFSSSGWEAHASAGFFGFGAHGGGRHDESRQEYNGSFNSDTFKLSFEIAQVPIVRPWLKSSFLVSKTWRFDPGNPDVKNDVLSDGGLPPKGLIPAYPTTAIFIRNLFMDVGHSDGFSSYMNQFSSSAQSGGGGFSFGPFSFGGGASHYTANGETSRTFGFNWDGHGLSVPGMQLVGYRCHVLPKSPDPSPGITAWV
jgi:hypothetical protein